MNKINRSRFFRFFGTGLLGAAVFRNFNFSGLIKKKFVHVQVQVSINPLSVSRNKSGESNVRK